MSDFPGNTAIATSPKQQRELERFCHYEARLLDNRQYKQWLGLVTQDIKYTMPARVNVQIDNRDRGSEQMLALDNELEGPDSAGCPLREEGYIHLMLRVERAYKINSWSENPPSRTRRLVGNVELMSEDGEQLTVISNFHLYYARPGNESFIYSGQRRDVLRRNPEEPDSFLICRRELIMDYAEVEVPTLGLLL